MEKFTEHDCFDAVEYFINAVDDLGRAMFDSDNFHPFAHYFENTLESGPSDDGLFYLKDWDGDILDEDGLTLEELSGLLEEYRQIDSSEKEFLRRIQILFPQCTRAGLNTGDY